MINTALYGEPHEFNANEDIVYPCCFISSEVGSIDRVNKVQQYVFRFHFYDLVHVATDTEANEEEVLSDMSQVADDFLSMISNPVYQEDWFLADTGLKGLATEQLHDMVGGAQLEVGINIDYIEDSCQVPADDVEFPQDIDMPRTKILTYTATGGENSFAVPTLSGKHVLAAWRALAYKRVVAVVPNDDEKIQVGVTDAGNGQGIVGDGMATLRVGDQLIADEKVDFLYYGT